MVDQGGADYLEDIPDVPGLYDIMLPWLGISGWMVMKHDNLCRAMDNAFPGYQNRVEGDTRTTSGKHLLNIGHMKCAVQEKYPDLFMVKSCKSVSYDPHGIPAAGYLGLVADGSGFPVFMHDIPQYEYFVNTGPVKIEGKRVDRFIKQFPCRDIRGGPDAKSLQCFCFHKNMILNYPSLPSEGCLWKRGRHAVLHVKGRPGLAEPSLA